jgi:large subunit ribosomal protein L29
MSKLAIEREELRACDDDELDNRLINARKELFNLRFQVATGRLDNVARIQQVRREVARIVTIQRDREIVAAEANEVEDAHHKHHHLESSVSPDHPLGRKEARRLRRRAAAEAAEAEAALHAPAEEDEDVEDVADENVADEDVIDTDDADAVSHETADATAHGADDVDDLAAEDDDAAELTDDDDDEAVSSASKTTTAGGSTAGDEEEGE